MKTEVPDTQSWACVRASSWFLALPFTLVASTVFLRTSLLDALRSIFALIGVCVAGEGEPSGGFAELPEEKTAGYQHAWHSRNFFHWNALFNIPAVFWNCKNATT